MCFDTAKSKISKNEATPAKKYGFTKQKYIRGDKTLEIWNFGPNVVYFWPNVAKYGSLWNQGPARGVPQIYPGGFWHLH